MLYLIVCFNCPHPPPSYPCEWGGVTDGKPYVKGLEEFEKAVLDDLWEALLRHHIEVCDRWCLCKR